MSKLASLTHKEALELAADTEKLWKIFPTMHGHACVASVDMNGKPDGPVIHIRWFGFSVRSVRDPQIPDLWLLREQELWDASILKSLPPSVRLTTSLEDFHNYSLEGKQGLLSINPHLLPLSFTTHTQIGFFQHHKGEDIHPFMNEGHHERNEKTGTVSGKED
ncbi:MAG: hypothetical protein OSB62_07880 [Alphaproteobacteria bacterium]|nr:hypothetical protein [Alphaproteobacteria bacterium]